MQAKNIALATVLAAVFAGNAFAAQPVSGEGPLFQNEPVTVSTLSRAEVAAARSAGQGWLIVGMDGVSAAWWRAALQASGTPAATPVALRLP